MKIVVITFFLSINFLLFAADKMVEKPHADRQWTSQELAQFAIEEDAKKKAAAVNQFKELAVELEEFDPLKKKAKEPDQDQIALNQMLKKKDLVKDKDMAHLSETAFRIKKLPYELQSLIFDFTQELRCKKNFEVPTFSGEYDYERGKYATHFYNPVNVQVYRDNGSQCCVIQYKHPHASASYDELYQNWKCRISGVSGAQSGECEEISAVFRGCPLVNAGVFEDLGLMVRCFDSSLIEGNGQSTLILWDLKTDSIAKDVQGRSYNVQIPADINELHVKLLSTGKCHKVAVGYRNKIAIVDVASNLLTHETTLSIRGPIDAFVLYDNGCKMLMASQGLIRVADNDARNYLTDAQGKPIFLKFNTPVDDIQVYQTTQNWMAIIIAQDGSVYIWNLNTGKIDLVLEKIMYRGKAKVFSDKDTWYIATADRSGLKIWDLVSGKLIRNCSDKQILNQSVRFIEIFEDNGSKKFLVGTKTGLTIVAPTQGIFERIFRQPVQKSMCLIQ